MSAEPRATNLIMDKAWKYVALIATFELVARHGGKHRVFRTTEMQMPHGGLLSIFVVSATENENGGAQHRSKGLNFLKLSDAFFFTNFLECHTLS
jgi:hypothetical protein